MNENFYLIIKHLIRCEYILRADILTNIGTHIDNQERIGIMEHTKRKQFINELHTIMLKLNTEYNNCLPKYKKIRYTPTVYETHMINNLNYEGFVLAITSYPNILHTNIKKYFIEIDKRIYTLIKNTGTLYVSDILKLSVGNNYREIMRIDDDVNKIKTFININKKDIDLKGLLRTIHNSVTLLDIIIQQFNAVEIYIYNDHYNNNTSSVLIKKYKYNEHTHLEESNKFKYELMLENCYKITIKCAVSHKIFVLIGYFNFDVINSVVVTSQICNNYIYYKKKLLIEYAKKNTIINDSYKDIYLSNISLGDILSFKGNELVDKLLLDYELYTKSCNLKFKITVNEFLKSNLIKKYTILKCLLIGPSNSIKNAAMLFGMAKDQNTDSKNNRSCVADILFRNLNHSQQNKLRKTNQCIKQELDKIKKITSDDMDLKQQCIMNNNMSDYVKKCVITRLEEIQSKNNDYQKNNTYIKTLINYPWIPKDYEDMFTTIGSDIIKCRNKLKIIKDEFDKRIFGQDEFKTVICDIVGKWFSNPNSMGKAIGLCGPPGVGKTLIASGLGKILGIPYQEIHLGGLSDGSVLNGHSFTYSDSQPGLIVNHMIKAGKPRCILFFDELDKTCSKHNINEIFNVLIHVTDPNTNDKFSDKFFQDISFPLNKCIFIFSFNDVEKVDPILRDRMEIINVSPYSQSDKIIIAKNYLIPELLSGIGIEKKSIMIANNTIETIIDNYTLEAGVRKLKNCIEKLFLKMNIDRIYGRGPFKNREHFSNDNPIKLTKSHVLKYLGKTKLTVEKIHLTNQVGVINGLYATTIGSGGILPILCYSNKNNTDKFTLEFTGKMGKVMQESISFAWTIAKNCTLQHIVDKFYELNKGGLHIHAPEGAVSKDGPSAGSAFTVAFISRITGFPIKHNIAMTGEINIGGDVTAIGGLVYKLTGAKIAGIKLVFVCCHNIDDVKKIKDTNPGLFNIVNINNNDKILNKLPAKYKKYNSYTDGFNIMIINTIYDIIPYVLVDPSYIKKYYNNGEYKPYDITCDIDSIMYKHKDGFTNIIC
jgi:endopeptidase La